MFPNIQGNRLISPHVSSEKHRVNWPLAASLAAPWQVRSPQNQQALGRSGCSKPPVDARHDPGEMESTAKKGNLRRESDWRPMISPVTRSRGSLDHPTVSMYIALQWCIDQPIVFPSQLL